MTYKNLNVYKSQAHSMAFGDTIICEFPEAQSSTLYLRPHRSRRAL